jgi:hypothetical protein|nr:MAG TPA: hypothetical protein [Caudoviricetes sp.]
MAVAENTTPIMEKSITERSYKIMKLIPVDQIPKMNGYHKLQELIEEFVSGNAKIVKVDFSTEDYKSPTVCRSCLAAAIKRSKRSIKVWRRGSEVFLSKDI